MTMSRFWRLTACVLGLCVVAMPVWSQSSGAAPVLTVRPKLAADLQTVRDALAGKKYAAALEGLQGADKTPEVTPAERYLIERLRAAAAVGAEQPAVAAASLEKALQTGQAPAAEQANLAESLARLHFEMRHFPAAAQWAKQSGQWGNASTSLRVLQAQALFFSNEFAETVTVLREADAMQAKAGTVPPQAQLELLASAHLKLKQESQYMAVLERLISLYPKPDYWSDLLARVENQGRMSPDLMIDLKRLTFHVGAMEEAQEYVELAELALKAGFPVEARQVLEQGRAQGLVPAGAQADQQRRLIERVSRMAQEDAAQLSQSRDGAVTDSQALFAQGFNLGLWGQPGLGLKEMELAIDRGIKKPDHARLRLAEILIRSGKAKEAGPWLSKVAGDDGATVLARLWRLASTCGAKPACQ